MKTIQELEKYAAESFHKQASEDNKITGISDNLDAYSYRRKTLSVINWWIGKFRLLFKFCPECNSDAPKVYDCPVCYDNREAFYKWNDRIKSLWWYRYVNNKTR